jgi:hypothetical protein
MNGKVEYVSKVRIERIREPLRGASLLVEADPVLFRMHSEVAKHYDVDPSSTEPHATALDYLVVAAAG